MDFLYPFLNFLQPGILWPELAVYRPILVVSVIVGLLGSFKSSQYSRSAAFAHPAFLFMAIFIFTQVLSVYYSGVLSMLEELDYWNVYLLFSAISIVLIVDTAALERYIWGMIVGSMVIVFYGVYAVYAHLPAAIGGRAGAYGMYENQNDYSFIVIMTLPFIYMFWKTRTGTFKRLLLFIFMLASVFGVFLSLSRGGMLALVLEAGLIVIITFDKKKQFGYLFLLVLLGTAAIAYQFVAREDNQAGVYTLDDSEYSRLELWKAGKNIILSRPLLGVGSRRFGEFDQQYGEISGWDKGKNAHNTFIDILATSGLLGFVSFALMLRNVLRGLKTRVTHPELKSLEPIRLATQIAIYSIIFRALFDAKEYDWSFYILSAIGISCIMLQRGLEQQPDTEVVDKIAVNDEITQDVTDV
ncbi:MAG: O-antigen ligase family protein [Sulfuricaulis sp.]